MKSIRYVSILALLTTLLPLLQGCFPAVATGVAVGVMTLTDRRTVGAQTEDETIEWKVSNRITERFGDKVHVNATCYNRKVLLTGEVADESTRAEIARMASAVENVIGAFNELQISGISSLSARSTDSYITSKVKARFIDGGKFSPNHVKVVTEAQAVYLMGIVSENEARAAIQIARTTEGVRKVVNILEIVSEAEIRRLDRMPANNKTNAQATPPTRRD